MKTKVYQPLWDVLSWSSELKMMYQSLCSLLGLGTGEVWDVISLKLRMGGWITHSFFCDNSGPFAIVSGLLEWLINWEAYNLPTCLAGCRLMLLTFRAFVCIVSMVSLHFSWPQWGEEVSAGNFSFELHLGVVGSCGGCCRLIGSFVSIIYRFPLSSLLTEFLSGLICSNCGAGTWTLTFKWRVDSNKCSEDTDFNHFYVCSYHNFIVKWIYLNAGFFLPLSVPYCLHQLHCTCTWPVFTALV